MSRLHIGMIGTWLAIGIAASPGWAQPLASAHAKGSTAQAAQAAEGGKSKSKMHWAHRYHASTTAQPKGQKHPHQSTNRARQGSVHEMLAK